MENISTEHKVEHDFILLNDKDYKKAFEFYMDKLPDNNLKSVNITEVNVVPINDARLYIDYLVDKSKYEEALSFINLAREKFRKKEWPRLQLKIYLNFMSIE